MAADFIKGYIQVYTGNGKGKTTAALGLAMRAAGHGISSYFAQFMKGQKYGELAAAKRLNLITIEQFGSEQFVHVNKATAEDIRLAKLGLKRAAQAMACGRYRIVVLDEVNVALYFKLLTVNEVLKFIDQKPDDVELILTGRFAPQQVIDRADLVTEMREVKHYFQKGVAFRQGIEN